MMVLSINATFVLKNFLKNQALQYINSINMRESNILVVTVLRNLH